MTKLDLSPFFPSVHYVGVDRMMNDLHMVQRNAETHYPPHNIIQVSDTEYIIELACAGFSKNQMNITVEERNLVITGSIENKTDAGKFLHKGISTKKFRRLFKLAEFVVVDSADVIDGVLSVSLKVEVPEEKKPKVIPIGSNYNNNSNSSEKKFLTG